METQTSWLSTCTVAEVSLIGFPPEDEIMADSDNYILYWILDSGLCTQDTEF